MLKIFNFSNYYTDLERINSDSRELENCLLEHRMDGIELLICQAWDPQIIPARLIKGIHLSYWPIWLEFWQGKQVALLEHFGSQEKIREYYGGDQREILVEKYRTQIQEAEKIGAQYVVFHVGHTQLKHLFDHQFTCTDEEVVEASIELINQIFTNLESKVTLLLENLWMSGLTFLKPGLVERLLKEIHYPHKGFMLDTGHLLNTNPYLTSQQEGIAYILETLKKLGDLKKYIRGIHLQKSLSGPYVLANRKTAIAKENIMEHIMQIDEHGPFSHPDIQKVVEAVQPDYLVYEFITRTKEQWFNYLETQNRALNL